MRYIIEEEDPFGGRVANSVPIEVEMGSDGILHFPPLRPGNYCLIYEDNEPRRAIATINIDD